MSHHSRTGTDESTPANKSLRKLRFSERPDEVFVYESQPSSPKRILALLPAPPSKDASLAPPSTGDNAKTTEDVTPLSPHIDTLDQRQTDEHTPDAIRQKYFPNEPPASENPTLAWLTASDTKGDVISKPSTSTRYDLQGRVIPPRLVGKLPSHLGLHHHGDNPDEAGYTLDELLMLSRSTLPAQRAATLQVLARLLTRMREEKNPPQVKSLQKQEEEEAKLEEERASAKFISEIFQKCVIVGIEAFGERASATVRIAGLDVIWAGLVHSNGPDMTMQEDQEQLETLPLAYLYSATVFNLNRTALTSASMVKLFEVLKTLVNISTKVAEELVEIPGLLDLAVRGASLDTVIDTPDSSATFAMLYFMKTLVSVSRKCAQALIPGVSDSFLRYIVTFQSSKPQQSISSILELYSLLGRYGLGASIASTGQEYFQRLAIFITQDLSLDTPESLTLVTSWLELIETWIVCAIDPHKTTPEHDILWSQVVAWQWSTALLHLRGRLLLVDGEDVPLMWSAWWRAWAAWLHGCRINEVNQGEHELRRWGEAMQESWGAGRERRQLDEASSLLQTGSLNQLSSPTLLNAARTLHSIVLLFEAHSTGTSPLAPLATAIVGNVTKDANWVHVKATCTPQELRIWTNMLANLARGVPINLRYSVLNLLIPGDEILAARLISDILNHSLIPENAHDLNLPEDTWTAAGGPAKILLPLYQYALWPQEDLFIAPLFPNSPALPMTTTLRTPVNSMGVATPSGGILGIRLPQESLGDWMISALDILLRSGSTHSRLFRSLPPDWTASESEVVRSLILFLLQRPIPLSRSQVVFTCMKVFMLEHGQATLEDGEEVYQNAIVGQLMLKLVQPLRYSASSQPLDARICQENPSLDVVAKSFLGPEQPFYQFYSDFLGLYDSSSFGHTLFGTLVLSPTSQLYPKDFRKLLWGDYGHTLRSIQVQVQDILAVPEELQRWLSPIEGRHDGEMLSLYVKALVRNHVTGFLRFVAVHQVAGCLWPDMIEDGVTGNKVLKAILTSTDESLLSEVLYYHQSHKGEEPLLPPTCYESVPSLAASRLEWAVSVVGESVRKRFPS